MVASVGVVYLHILFQARGLSWTLELNYEIQAGPDLPVLPQPAEGWVYRSEPPCLASLYLQSWGIWFILEVKEVSQSPSRKQLPLRLPWLFKRQQLQ